MATEIAKNRKGQVINSRKKQLVVDLYKEHVQQRGEKQPPLSANEVAGTISETVGIGRRKVWDILREYMKTGRVSSPSRKRPNAASGIFDRMSEGMRSKIRCRVHEFYASNTLPSLDNILEAINKDEELPNLTRSTLYRVLKKLNFRFGKRGRESVMVERDEIVCWRRKYLREIRRHRVEGRRIYYLDETSLSVGNVVFDELSDGVKYTSREKRLVIIHIGSRDGFVDGGLIVFECRKDNECRELNANYFENWFSSVLPELEPESVIVMDTAPYHSRKLNKNPTEDTKKEDMIRWLQTQGIVVDGSQYLKCELLEMVRRLRVKEKYAVDEMAAKSGRTVLRLPPYHGELNAIEYVWADIRNYVAKNNKTFSLKENKELLSNGLSRITPGKWREYVQHIVTEVEPRMWRVDILIEELVEPFLETFDSNGDVDYEEYNLQSQ